MEIADVIALTLLVGAGLSFVRFVITGPPPVKWTRSWTRMLWRALTRRNPN